MSADATVLIRYLAQIRVHAQSGMLEVRSEGEVTRLYFREGFLVYARVCLDEGETEPTGRAAERALLVQQVLIDCFRYEAPQCSFDPITDAYSHVDEFPAAIEPLVLRGIQRHYGEESVGAILFPELEGYLSLSTTPRRIAERLHLDDDERAFVEIIDGQMTTRDALVNSQLDVVRASQIVTALIVLDMAMAWTEPPSIRPTELYESEPAPAAPSAPTTVFDRRPLSMPPPAEPEPPPRSPATPASPPPRPESAEREDVPMQPETVIVGRRRAERAAAPRPPVGKAAGGAKTRSGRLFATLAGHKVGPTDAERKAAAMARAKAIRKQFGNRPRPEAPKALESAEIRLEAASSFRAGKTKMNLGDWRKAVGFFDRAHAQDPDEPRYTFYMKWAEFQVTTDEASKERLKAELAVAVKQTLKASNEEDDAFAYYVLGRLCLLDGDEKKAKRALKAAIRLDDSLVDAQRHLRMMAMRSRKK